MHELLSADPILALASEEIIEDPYPAYAWMRDRQPIFWYEPLRSWMFTRHADAVEVLRDSSRFGSDWRRVGEDVPPQAISVQLLDPPEHTAIRRLMMDALRTVDLAATESAIAEYAESLSAGLPERFDVVSEFAEPMALRVITVVLGVSPPDSAWFVPAADAISAGMDAGIWADRLEPAMAARAEIASYTRTWLEDPPDRGVAGFMARHAASSGVGHTVIANSLRTLLHAGYASASKFLGLAILGMLSTPDGLGSWPRSDPSLAVEELARFTSPVQAVARACVEETDVAGVRIGHGDAVTVLVGAANRDPARFDDPDTLRLDRQPNAQLGFGRGPHSCLGSRLAGLAARTAFSALSERCPGLRAAEEPEYGRNLTLRSLARLEVSRV